MNGNFAQLAKQVAAQWKLMSEHELFVVAIDGQQVWDQYLDSFPEGTNEIYRVRRAYDGSYDRNVIRKIGNVVAVIDGKYVSIWDIPAKGYYADVFKAMSELIHRFPIESIFRTKESKFGYESTIERLKDGGTQKWNHFNVVIAGRHWTNDVGTKVGEANAVAHVFKRGLDEIKAAALEQIVELITANSLYRGEEHLSSVQAFARGQRLYNNGTDAEKNILVWINLDQHFARFRNTVIGTLAIDLSNDVPLEDAVKMFESKVAPANYKRTTALITQSMIDQAMKTINELDLEPALDRRMAVLEDISVNDVLWVASAETTKLKGGISQILTADVKQPVKNDSATPITINTFLDEVVPGATAIEALFENRHQGNLMNITAPVHADVEPIFKWDNNFAWSYNGNITDSIKEKVKAAGGNVEGKLRFSLAWFNFDDLDLHLICPNGEEISFRNKRPSRCGGELDVDMNAGVGKTREPVENISFAESIPNGKYLLIVDQYSRRETDNIGFTLQVSNNGKTAEYSYTKGVTREMRVMEITMNDGEIQEMKLMDKSITGRGISKEIWNLQTEQFVPVSIITNSPNYWEGKGVGNRHLFFMLKGAKNPEAARGIYNEFLLSSLDKHRKVFEVLGNKTKCQPTDNQLAGLGFSTTQGNKLIVRVTDSRHIKLFEIRF